MALSSELRSVLEKAVVAARDAAEDASRAALGVLAVDTDRAPDSFDEGKRRLRVALRAEARQLGGFERLVEECAYEQWHRMLFARFLAENDLLIHPEHGVAVTLAECEEIAHARGESDLWLVASEFASTMLPGIFRSDDPILQVTLAPEGQQRLEEILASLPPEVFTSEDGLGWVYQYWQAKKKKEVNASERKIGGADIAPVTQLFTENYMVRFLLENTLGAWWAARNPGSPLVKEWEYLRFDEGGKPAAGSFPGWPETVAEVTAMDPCCGSGHFLVVAFEMLRKMRMETEGLSAAEAGDAVLADNLFGLELDPRCTQIAAFALALQAWKTGGYRELPIPNVACSGISAKGRLEDWKKLAQGDERLERSLERLHALFSDAGDLGSLIDPLRETDGELLMARFDEIAAPLEEALNREIASDPSSVVFGGAAAGAMRATQLLARRYTLIVTNPPFLGRGKQEDELMKHCSRQYPLSKADLATCFIERNVQFADQDSTVAMVTPQSWLSLTSYSPMRSEVFTTKSLCFVAILGTRAFASISGEVVNVALAILSNGLPPRGWMIAGLEVSDARNTLGKAVGLRTSALVKVDQMRQLRNPDLRLILDPGYDPGRRTLGAIASIFQGSSTGDDARFLRSFWELRALGERWKPFLLPSEDSFGGRSHVWDWDDSGCELKSFAGARIQGFQALGKRGLAVSASGAGVAASMYLGEHYNKALATVIPVDNADLEALYVFVRSGEFQSEVRRLDRKLMVTPGTFGNVPFDPGQWRARAAKELPGGLPTPAADDPTQWLFPGHLRGAEAELQVALACLVGYRWPRQTGSEFLGCPALGADGLESFADEDGIVCIPAVRGERPAAERLRVLLAAAFGDEWSPAKEADLLAEAGCAGKSLEQWLRDGFFDQHCQLFHQRPFMWHVWDGKRDGFSVLVNYHSLDRQKLEKLIYGYLGDWIRLQREAAAAEIPGADQRLADAEKLKEKLELILEGEKPYDIFVRWKPLEEQPIGWEPDLNDGVRLNIRPFVTAGVLRKNPKIKWGKDRGKDPESAPWYPVFKGDRINDHHLTLAEKRAAREAAERRAAAS
ncbi:MAG: SAM-dependent DNA methyltransferase [Thermoleophilia bacterium]|nr:SAM-dependent DNA methyltransferase [Thermoleophilia bacterium]